jgi:hypothetical protein
MMMMIGTNMKEWRTEEGTRNAGMGMWLSLVQRTLAADY